MTVQVEVQTNICGTPLVRETLVPAVGLTCAKFACGSTPVTFVVRSMVELAISAFTTELIERVSTLEELVACRTPVADAAGVTIVNAVATEAGAWRTTLFATGVQGVPWGIPIPPARPAVVSTVDMVEVHPPAPLSTRICLLVPEVVQPEPPPPVY